VTPGKATGRPASAASLRRLDEKLRRMAAEKGALRRRQAELRQRALALPEASDQAMLARARRRMEGIRSRDRAIAFELTGTLEELR
jgi:hypothetical protein